MKTYIRKIGLTGNLTKTITIPKELCKFLKLDYKDYIQLKVENNKITIEKLELDNRGS